MQHFRVKIFATAGPGFVLASAIPVFHRWIQKHVFNELLIDVADYQHVPAGPGIMLVGHDAYYSLDEGGDRLGLLYSRRTALEGTTQSKIVQALDAATNASRQLEIEPEFAGELKFTDEFEISVNDRLLAPNTAETRSVLEPDLEAVLDGKLGKGSYSLDWKEDPRGLLAVSVTKK